MDALRFVAAVFRAVRGHIGAGRTVRVGEAMRGAEVPVERAQAALDFAFANYSRSSSTWETRREAARIMRRIEFHYTPKHASWLNMADIEIGVLKRQCLARRIPNITMLRREVARMRERNRSGATIQWMFGLRRARAAFGNWRLLDQPAARAAA